MTGDGTTRIRPGDANGADPGAEGVARRLAWLFAFVAGVAVVGIGLATTYQGREFLEVPQIAWGVVQLLAYAAPWVVGAALLQIRPRWGTVVLVTSAGLALLQLVPMLVQVIGDTAVRGGDAGLVLAGYAPYPFMLAAGAAAFVGRPRGGWTTGPAVHPLVAVPIALNFLIAWFSPLLPALPRQRGRPVSSWFGTTFGPDAMGEPWVAAYLAVTVLTIVGLVLTVTRLRGGAAGVVLLVLAIPSAVSSFGSIVRGLGQPEWTVSPAAYVSAAAAIVLVAVGVRWVREDPEPAPRESR